MKTELKFFFTLWLVYALYVTPAGGVTPNRYVDLVHSIVNEGRFEIDTYHDNTIDKAYYAGHYYMGALPGPAFVSVPPYVLFKSLYTVLPQQVKSAADGIQSFKLEKAPPDSFYRQVDNSEFFLSQMFLHMTVVALISALSSLFVFKTVRLLTRNAGVAFTSTIFYALGTFIFFYSTLLFEQIFTAAIASSLIYMGTRLNLSKDRRDVRGTLFLMGFIAGLDILMEPTAVFLILGIGLWVLLLTDLKRVLLYFGAGIVIPVGILLAYNSILFASPFSFVYSHLVAEFSAVNSVGFLGVSAPQLDRLLEVTLGVRRGLFLYAPVSMVGLAGLIIEAYKSRAKNLIALIGLLVIGMYLVFLSAYSGWYAGAAFGPRYLIGVLPFLAVGIGFAFAYLPHWLVYLTGIISIAINWTGAMFGFTESPAQSLATLIQIGPVLPIFGAILSHAGEQNSLFIFATRFAVLITIVLTVLVAVLFLWLWHKTKLLSGLDQNDAI